MKKLFSCLIVIAAAVLATSLVAQAGFPEKPVKIIVPFPAGGSTDGLFRASQPYLQKYLNQKIVITNIKGAGGSVGLKRAVSARPDGYTLGIYAGNIPVQEALGAVKFGSNEIQGVAHLVNMYLGVATRWEGPYKTLKDIQAAAQKNPGKIGIAMGHGTLAQFGSIMVAKGMGVKLKYVNIGDGAEKMTAVLGGHVETLITPMAGLIPHHRAKKLRILASMSPERLDFSQDIPSTYEQGCKAAAYNFSSIVVAQGTPADRVQILSQAIKKMGEDPEYQKLMAKLMLIWDYKDAQGLAAFIESYRKDIFELKKDAGF
jgi:tripartite-type tricarboxylate transporter receptor subunit TctC